MCGCIIIHYICSLILYTMTNNKRLYSDFVEQFSETTKDKIKTILRKDEPLGIQAIATSTELSYMTVKMRLLELIADHEVISHKVGKRSKVFFINPDYESQSEVKE